MSSSIDISYLLSSLLPIKEVRIENIPSGVTAHLESDLHTLDWPKKTSSSLEYSKITYLKIMFSRVLTEQELENIDVKAF